MPATMTMVALLLQCLSLAAVVIDLCPNIFGSDTSSSDGLCWTGPWMMMMSCWTTCLAGQSLRPPRGFRVGGFTLMLLSTLHVCRAKSCTAVIPGLSASTTRIDKSVCSSGEDTRVPLPQLLPPPLSLTGLNLLRYSETQSDGYFADQLRSAYPTD